MRAILLSLCLSSLLFGDSPLSDEKAQLLELKRQKLISDADKLQNSWISPINLQAGWTKNVNAGKFGGTTTSAGIRLNQDIFRSGGIWYAIDYAKAFAQASKIGIDIEEANILKRLYTLKVQILRDEMKVRQSKLLLKNREIDVQIVKENYKAGDADVSQLNRVTIDSDSARTALINAKSLLRSEKYELKKLIGDKDIKALKIPEIPLVDKENYLEKNLEVLRLQKQIESDQAYYKTTRAKYLPKVTLSGNYGYSKFRGDLQNYDGDEYSYGAQLSVPLDINTKNDIQSNKITYLQSKLSLKDKKSEFEKEYDKRFYTISDNEEKIKVSQKMLNMYDELYRFTRSEVQAGTKTKLDLNSLANSREVQKLEQQIQEQNIILEKMALFFDLKR